MLARTVLFQNKVSFSRIGIQPVNKACCENFCARQDRKLVEDIRSLLFQRNIRKLESIGCDRLQKALFLEDKCAFRELLEKEVVPLLGFASERDNDIYVHQGTYKVYPEALLLPQGTPDLTGDRGLNVAQFLEQSKIVQYLKNVKNLVDIGANDTETTVRIKRMAGSVEHTIVMDINALTPFVNSQKKGVFYMVGDAIQLFSDKESLTVLKKEAGVGLTLYFANNFLNVLSKRKALIFLAQLYEAMNEGDLLYIGGLHVSGFKTSNLWQVEDHPDSRGLHSVFKNTQFYKTAIAPVLFEDHMEKLGFRIIDSDSVPYIANVPMHESFASQVTGLNVLGYRCVMQK